MEITVITLSIIALCLSYLLYREKKTHKALKYMTLDMLLDPQKHHQIRHDMLRPISSSAFNGKLAVMDANKFLDSFSKKYTNDNKDPMNEQAKLMDAVLNTYG